MLISRHLVGLSLFLVLLSLSSLVFADDFDSDVLEDYYGDEEFVSIATGAKKVIHKAPAVASVITADDIKQMGARNLSDVLDTVPGLHVSRSGQLMAPEFWFRGITSTFNPQTLMMINGVSTKSSVRGDNHIIWGEFPIHSIQRIEIIRGPGSALYGADAFSGVINIITKKYANASGGEIGGMLGSFNTQNLWVNNSFILGNWQFSTNLEHLESDGYKGYIDADAQTIIDQVAGGFGVPPASLAPGRLSKQFKATDFWLSAENDLLNIELATLRRYDMGSGIGATEVLDNKGISSGYKNIISIESKDINITNLLSFTSKLSYYGSSQEIDEDFLLFPEGAFFGSFPDGLIGNPEWQEETSKFEIDLNYLGFENSELRFGLGYERQNLYEVTEQKNFLSDLSPRPDGLVDVSDTAEVFMPEADRESHFLYAQSVSQIAPDWELTLGARYDDYTDFGSTFNPRAALVWSTSLKMTTKFLYGRAFRAPAFAELIVVNNPIALGNPDLKPETIDTFELALNYKYSADLSLDFNLYDYKIDDFITFVPDLNGQTATAQNVGIRTGKGFEANLDYSFSNDLKIITNMAYVKAIDDLADDDVGEYPNFQTYIRSEWSINDNWKLNTQISKIGSRERVYGDPRNKLDGYTLTNLSSSYQFSEHGTLLEFTISNLFDEDIREPSSAGTTLGSINVPNDLPQAGRAFYFGVRTTY